MARNIIPSTDKRESAGEQVTLSRVAQAAGVSLATASQALSGKSRIAPRTRLEVRRIADELGYQGNPLAKALARGFVDDNITLFALAMDLGVRTQKINLTQQRLRNAGFRVSLNVDHLISREDSPDQASMVRAICQLRPRAILCDAAGTVSAETLQLLRSYQSDGGIVVADNVALDIPCDQVTLDRETMAYNAVRHLLSLGHRKIGFRYHGIFYPENKPDGRSAGYERALREYGLTMRPDWVFWGGEYEEGGAKLTEDFLALSDRPTALCIINDVSASVFVTQLQRRGLTVPRDLSIVSHDDTPAARYCAVPLTTMRYPVTEMAEATAEMVLSRLQGRYPVDGPPRHLHLTGDIVERESCAAPPA